MTTGSTTAMLLMMMMITAVGACNQATDCLAPNSACWCGKRGDVWEAMTCPACGPNEVRMRCGCYTPEQVGPRIDADWGTYCSSGICVPTSWKPNEYVVLDDISTAFRQWATYSNVREISWVKYTFECKCPLDTQKRVGGCVNGVLDSEPVCELCGVGRECNGLTDQDPLCQVGTYCLDGKAIPCDTKKAQQCTMEGMTDYTRGCLAGSFYGQSLCTPCATGSYLAANGVHTALLCTLCEAGTSYDEAGAGATTSSVCKTCGMGTYEPTQGKTGRCDTCEVGTYQNNMGRTSCIECLPGTFWDNGAKPCVPCSPGRYTSVRRSVECTPCEVGTYAVGMSSSTCEACPAGKSTRQWNRGELQTTGYLGKTGLSDCSFCAPGYIVDERQDCVACPSMFYCPGGNVRTLYTEPRAGYYFVFNGNSTSDRVLAVCKVCGPDEYVAEKCIDGRGTRCARCKQGSNMLFYVKEPCTSEADAVVLPCMDVTVGSVCNPCLPGTELRGNQCVVCSANLFSERGGACVPCAGGYVSGPGASMCTRDCPSGQFASNGAACQALGLAIERQVLQSSRLQAFAAMAWDDDGTVVVATNRGESGLLWRVDSTNIWLLAGAEYGSLDRVAGLIALGDNTYLLAGAQKVRLVTASKNEIVRVYQNAEIGGIAQMDGRVFVVSDRLNNRIWASSTVVGTSDKLLRGSVEGLRSTGFQDTRGFFCQPTAIAVDAVNTVIVLDNYGIWTFDARVEEGPTRGVCGGGSIGNIQNNPDYMADRGGVQCNQLDFTKLGVKSMTTGSIRGMPSVVLAMTNGGIAYFTIGNWWMYVLTSTPYYESVFYGNLDGGAPRLFAGGMMGPNWMVVSEIGLGRCLCKEGLYCMDERVCVQAPVGTFAPAWSHEPIQCKMGTVSTGPGATNRSAGCQVCPNVGGWAMFTTPADGAINCVLKCRAPTPFFDKKLQACVAGCGVGQYMSELGSCTLCPYGAQPLNGAACVPCAVGQWAKSEGVCEDCPSGTTTYFEASDRCTPGVCEDGGTGCAAVQFNTAVTFSDFASAGSEVVWAGSPTGGLWRFEATAREVVDATPHIFGYLEINDDESIIYSAAKGGNCVYQYDFQRVTVLVGQCAVAGDADGANGLFSQIQGLAYMHVEGHTPVLFVASVTSGCASIRAVSLFDASVSTFASYNEVRGNRVLFEYCEKEIQIATARGMDFLYYYYGGNIVQTRNDGEYAVTPVISAVGVRGMCVKSAWNGSMVLRYGTVGGVNTAVLQEHVGAITISTRAGGNITALAAMGQRVWVAATGLVEMWMDTLGSCLGGYVAMDGGCAQLGVGQYSLATGAPAACKSGTYGTRAGAWSSVFCKECPSGTISGEGALSCQPCSSYLPLSVENVCVKTCPIGTYRRDSRSCAHCPDGFGEEGGVCKPCFAGSYSNATSKWVCTACANGWSSQAGSHHCVRVCAAGQCSRKDGEQCSTLTENWKMLTSIQLVGGSMRTVTVSRNRHVFFSDGNMISYFQDDCGSQEENANIMDGVKCLKAGKVILSKDSDMMVDRGISSLAITKEYIDKRLTQRYLYAASVTTHSIYRLTVEFGEEVSIPVPDWKRITGGGFADFSDGGLEGARFNMPSELEISGDDSMLYVSDFGNHRIRLIDLKTQVVTTLLGNGMPCWRLGALSAPSPYPTNQGKLPASYCDGYTGERATAQRPMGIGLSRDSTKLYVAMFEENSVGVVTGGAFSQLCSLDMSLVDNTVESCRMDIPNSRSCFLWKPYDVAMTEQSLFVAVTNGVTKIDVETLACKQVSGSLWEMQAAQSRGYVDGELLNETCSTSRVHNPFKMVFASDTGIMYVADFSNGAVRRIFIDGRCMCPEGSMYVESARACYDPTTRWASRMLVECPTEGYFALEGDVSCRSCDEAKVAGLYIVKCMLWWNKQAAQTGNRGVPFSKVVATPKPYGVSFTADWFGVAGTSDNRQYDDMVNDAKMLYALRESPVPRAQSLRYAPDTGEWMLESDPLLQPQTHTPGFWYPCDIAPTQLCSGSERVLGGEWGLAREMGQRLGGRVNGMMDIWGWSRFMIRMTPGKLYQMEHIQERVTASAGTNTLLAGVGLMQRYVGWPALFVCPNGFAWAYEKEKGTCKSCLPGAYSTMRYPRHGPYECESCARGQYSSGVGSPACVLCGSGFYASALGSAECALCTSNYHSIPGAQSLDQCDPCEPGTGGCVSCVAGKWQHQAAQDECEYCAAGKISNTVNATSCTPCPVGTFQKAVGMMFCEKCPKGTYAPQTGATACSICNNEYCILAVGGVCGQGCGINQYWDESVRECARCPLGTLNTDQPCALDATGCWKPQAGKYFSVATGRIENCVVGFGPNADFTDCVPCSPGTYFSQGMGCVPCAGGQYGTGSGQSACLWCLEGAYSPALLSYEPSQHVRVFDVGPPQGQTACQKCAAGYFSARNGSAQCDACRAGTYAMAMGASSCLLCPNGTYGISSGATQICQETCNGDVGLFSGAGASTCTQCVGGKALHSGTACIPCGLGQYDSGYGICRACGIGLVNRVEMFGNSSTVCQRCFPPTTFAAARGTECWLARPGYIVNSDGTGEIACGPGTYRGPNDTMATACLKCPPGFISVSNASQGCVGCDVATFAMTEGMSTCGRCSPGLVAETIGSATCHPCKKGHTAAGGRVCEACGNNTYSVDGVSCWDCMGDLPYAPIGSSACLPCPDWTTMSGNGKCDVCETGKYMAHSDWRGYYCEKCPVGTITPHNGATTVQECSLCLDWYVPNAARSQCVACPAGQQKVGEGICGACVVGTYSSNGSMARCAQCSGGQYSPRGGATACLLCDTGHYGNTSGASQCGACDAGTFAATQGLTSCTRCERNEFTNQKGSRQCQNRTWRCAEGQYVVAHTDKPDMNNTCALCLPCKESEFMVTATTISAWLLVAQEPVVLCPGDTMARMYECVSNEPEAGYYFVGSAKAGGQQMGGGEEDGVGFDFSKQRCTDLDQATDGRFMFVRGKIPGCFVGCKYGVLNTDVYTAHVAGGRGDDPFNNVYLPLAIEWERDMCRMCPQSPCGYNTFRPKGTEQCGPSCSEWNCGDGCVGECKPPPEGATTVGGSSTLGNDICPWKCRFGWHISDDGLSCRACDLENTAEGFCPQGFVLVDTTRECAPMSNSSDLCKPCAAMRGGKAKGWNGGCTYECDGGYFSGDNTNTTCVSCSVYNDEVCPFGFFRDYVGCLERGLPPVCKPCAAPDVDMLDPYTYSFTSNGGVSATNCSALCDVGFHSFSLRLMQYSEEPMSVFLLQCRRCEPLLDTITCHGACQVGQYRNKGVEDGLSAGACARCITSTECKTGEYAPRCAGNESASTGCLPCAILPANRRFVAYSVRQDNKRAQLIYPLSGDCPSVCKPNFFVGAGGTCVSCRESNPDYPFSHWNATPGRMWWNVENHPPHLGRYTREWVERAGLCWACPYGEGTLENDQDLCMLLPGFGRSVEQYKMTRMQIPVLGPEVYLSLREPSMPYVDMAGYLSRRLLQEVSGKNPVGASSGAIISGNMQCQYGYYKPNRGDGSCFSCPYGTSTISRGAVSVRECLCKPGWRNVANDSSQMGCVPCPVDTFAHNGGCTPCPLNETTFGQEQSTACACKWGSMRTEAQTCDPCPANTYCRPCLKGETCEQASRVVIERCFLGSTSQPGSRTVENCTCGGGLVALKRVGGDQYYCSSMPPMAVYEMGRMGCTLGWKETWQNGQLVSCTLCEIGMYAAIPIYPTLLCKQCPVGTYSDTRDAIGGCIACPFSLSTGGAGTTSIEGCGCPPPLTPRGNGCSGCRADQFYDKGVCSPCPLNSISKAGGAGCQCAAGFYYDDTKCTACEVGTYAGFAGALVCANCPAGSSTITVGSYSVRQCTVCSEKYAWMGKMGCVLKSLLMSVNPGS